MANGYDSHSLGIREAASSSSMAPMVAVRDRRFTRNGIGYRTQAQEAMKASMVDYPGGVASRRRDEVNESLAWRTAQAPTSPQIRPRDTLPPSGLREALPPWLRGDEDEEREALPPWLRGKDDEEKESGRPGMRENDGWEDGYCGDGFPEEGEARDALAVLSQFVDGGTLKAIQNQIAKQYGDPGEEGADAPVPGFVGEAARALAEAPLDAKRRNDLDSSDFALPGRKYPIDTPARARSALARVQQFGSPEDQRKVKAAVRRKYPNMEID